jgi:hypothetical protein
MSPWGRVLPSDKLGILGPLSAKKPTKRLLVSTAQDLKPQSACRSYNVGQVL